MADRTILVPLDGSELAEGALPYAVSFARARQARLVLLTVLEDAEQILTQATPDYARQAQEKANEYLVATAKRLQAEGVDVETDLRIGADTEEILAAIHERDPELLVIATHGRSGISRWLYGSVASALVREAPIPTLVVGPKALDRTPPAQIARILVPLDGSELSETALGPARELAEALRADILLAQVLRWASQAYLFGVPDVDIGRIDQDLTEAAKGYLSRIRQELGTAVRVETAVLHGPPADALIQLAEEQHVDLVVMASHARTGVTRAVLGSVADRMIQGPVPVYLIRPEAAQPAGAPEHVTPKQEPRGRYCHACGRSVIYAHVAPDDRCPRCGQHLHVCANCVYYDGIACLLERPEVHDTYPGRNCPAFQFRETAPPEKAARKP